MKDVKFVLKYEKFIIMYRDNKLLILKEEVDMELAKQELNIIFDALLELYMERPLTDKESDLYIKIREQL
jgi:hypothetical protein